MKTIDFLIIGAQKSGTTTLFHLLSEHPNIFIPKTKEVPFFTNDMQYEKGLAENINEFFSSAPNDSLWGTVTPHYLSDPKAAERIALNLPNVKLIVILREPAERALSHYRMSVCRGIEERSFEQAITETLEKSKLKSARQLNVGVTAENKTYIVWGEYGRLLEKYYQLFPNNKILTLFTVELENNPTATLNKIWDFLGLPVVNSESIGKKFHQGGIKQWINFRKVKKIPGVIYIWRKLPINFTNWVIYSLSRINTVKSKASLKEYDSSLIKKLKNHFKNDNELLEQITKAKTPWP